MLQALAEENRESSSASEIDFKPLEDLDPRPWVMGFAGKGGLTAEFPFTSNTPSMLAAASGQGLGTAMLQLNTDFKHPQLGDGVLIRLTLPLNASPELTNALNLLEARDGANNADQLGGWCEDKKGPVFVTFIPTCLLERDWLVNFIYDNAIRTSMGESRRCRLGDHLARIRPRQHADPRCRRGQRGGLMRSSVTSAGSPPL